MANFTKRPFIEKKEQVIKTVQDIIAIYGQKESAPGGEEHQNYGTETNDR